MAGNSDAKPKSYEAVPFAIVLPFVRVPPEEAMSRTSSPVDLKNLPVQRYRTMDSSLQQAAKNTLDVLSSYKPRVRKDVRVVRELLEIHPVFIGSRWVADAAARFRRSPRSRRLRGRPKFGHTVDPRLVLGAVWALQMSGRVKSERRAARWLHDRKIMSSTRVRRLLQEAKKDPRLLSQFSYQTDRIRTMSEEELQKIFQTAMTGKDGQVIRFAHGDGPYNLNGEVLK